jgi:cyanophycin synthetase
LNTVPAAGEQLQLRRRNNASAGGVTQAVDKNTVHPDNQELCLRAARIMDLDIAGIDLLIPDITQSWLETGALICEVNAVPQVGYNHGITQIVDHIFQSGVRVPMHMAIVESWNTSDLHLAHELAAITGSNAFSASTGIWINGKCMSRPFDNGFAAARAVIFDQQVESAVCIMTKAEVAKLGLPLDQFDQILIENPDDVVNWVSPHSTNIKPLKVYRNE